MAPRTQFFPRLPDDIFSRAYDDGFVRLKVQGIDIGQQYIVDGIAFSSNWIETGLGAGGGERRFAAFDVPAGYYLALDYRLINTSGSDMWYFVYPEGTYTLGTASGNSGPNLVKNRNLRQGAPLSFSPLARYAVTTPPAQFTDSIIDVPIWGTNADEGDIIAGSLAQDSNFLLLQPDQQFLLEVWNDGTASSNIQVELTYALIPESLVPETA